MSYNPYNIINNNNNNNSQQQQPQPPLPPFGSTIQPTPSPLPPQGLPGPLPVTYPMMPPYGMMPGIPLIPNPPMAAYPTLPPPSGFPGFPTPGSSILMQQQPQAFGSQPGVPGGVMAPEQQLQQYLASANPISSMMKSEGHQLSGIANSSRSDGMKEIEVQHRSTPSDGSGQHVKTDPDKHDASRSSQGETEKEDSTNAKPVFKELSLDDLVAPPGPACVLDDPKLKAAYDYCDTTTAAVIDVAIRQATALCERGIEEQFEVAEAELRVASIEAEMEAYKSGMTVSKDSNDIENKRRRVAIYGGTLSPTQSQQHEQGSPESPDANVWGGGLSAGLGSRNNSPGATSLHSADQETAHKPSLPPRFGGGVRHHRRAPTSTTANVGNLENGGSAAASPPSSSISTDSSPAE